ncbi:RNA polymerase sigma-70 factor, ECF subfamily [Oceanobacillus limi]|uniref:RNA polymerase sigma factor n=1 Tax=Oceanobacillus limi TaxID=930131 RepID=A0A1H9YFE4_9BACI|nr:sigma-70 family RNA polymerase sigma factor [Oceanobacillus limi]SES67739.1 RNA polymerase sigma-70 factor, ECF subfamily [Oceanobacillus limi]
MQHLGEISRKARKEFETFIKDFRKDLWKYCLNLTGSPWEAEDLAQETILKAFAQLSFVYQSVNTKSYLFRVATNQWIDQCRKSKNIVEGDEEMFEQVLNDDEIDPIEIRASMEYLVQSLPPRQRVSVLLVDVFKFKLAETAEMLSLTEGAVKSLIHRARKNLKEKNIQDNVLDKYKLSDFNRNIVESYIKAFNERDADKIAGLLHEGAEMEIVGVTKEFGRETIRKYSLTDWERDPANLHASFEMLRGIPSILVYEKREGQQDGLSTIHQIRTSEEQILYIKDFYFCPELLDHFGNNLQVPSFSNGYFWNE